MRINLKKIEIDDGYYDDEAKESFDCSKHVNNSPNDPNAKEPTRNYWSNVFILFRETCQRVFTDPSKKKKKKIKVWFIRTEISKRGESVPGSRSKQTNYKTERQMKITRISFSNALVSPLKTSKSCSMHFTCNTKCQGRIESTMLWCCWLRSKRIETLMPLTVSNYSERTFWFRPCFKYSL